MNRLRDLKKQRFEIDGYRCTRCGETRIHLLTIHHVNPRSEGGEDSLGNLRTMCIKCHAESHRMVKRARVSRRARSREIRKAVKPEIRKMRDVLTKRVLELLAIFFMWLEEAIHASEKKKSV